MSDKRRTRTILGIDMVVRTAGELQRGGVLVCVPLTAPLLLPDNRAGECSSCAQAVQWNPSAPKRVRLLCLECAMLLHGSGEDALSTTNSIADRVEAELRKRRS